MECTPVKIVDKPWGREVWLCVENEYAGKILEIKKGCRTSLQYHNKKKESMYVLEGVLKITYPGGETVLKKGESITMNPGDRHRLCAVEELILIEVSTPELDDVVRLEDDHGRN
jgi:quercetin dioxygenase-like cupin family protein